MTTTDALPVTDAIDELRASLDRLRDYVYQSELWCSLMADRARARRARAEVDSCKRSLETLRRRLAE